MNTDTTRRTLLTGAIAAVASTAVLADSPFESKSDIQVALDSLNQAINAAMFTHEQIVIELAPILLPPSPIGDVFGPPSSNPIAQKIYQAATRVFYLEALQQNLLNRINL